MERRPADAWLLQADCVDLRSTSEHEARRPAGAVRLEVDDLLHRPYLLPPRSRDLVLVGGPGERMPLVVAALAAAGHPHVRHLPASVWEEHLPVETGPPRRTRLWEPAAIVAQAVDRHPLPRGSQALDLACGAGRNAVWLALQGFEVTAIDLLPDALVRVADLAARSGVAVRTEQRDLAFPGALDDLTADLVVVVRYLDRAALGALQRTIRPGGILVYETFTTDQLELGHPRNPKHLLHPGELAGAFPDLETLSYSEGHFDGAHLARLVARAAGR